MLVNKKVYWHPVHCTDQIGGRGCVQTCALLQCLHAAVFSSVCTVRRKDIQFYKHSIKKPSYSPRIGKLYISWRTYRESHQFRGHCLTLKIISIQTPAGKRLILSSYRLGQEMELGHTSRQYCLVNCLDSCRLQETRLKILSHWFRAPNRLHTFFSLDVVHVLPELTLWGMSGAVVPRLNYNDYLFLTITIIQCIYCPCLNLLKKHP